MFCNATGTNVLKIFTLNLRLQTNNFVAISYLHQHSIKYKYLYKYSHVLFTRIKCHHCQTCLHFTIKITLIDHWKRITNYRNL